MKGKIFDMEGRKGMGPVRKNLLGKCYPIFMGIPCTTYSAGDLCLQI